MIITVGNRTEYLRLGEVEHIFVRNEWSSLSLQVASVLVCFLIISLNGTIVKIIMKQERKTFLDWMIVIDSGLCISTILPLAMFISNAPLTEVGCIIKTGMMFFISIINRIVSVMIVIYRAIYVLTPQLVETQTKRRIINVILFGSLSFLSVGSTLGMAIYREEYKSFKGIKRMLSTAFNLSELCKFACERNMNIFTISRIFIFQNCLVQWQRQSNGIFLSSIPSLPQ